MSAYKGWDRPKTLRTARVMSRIDPNTNYATYLRSDTGAVPKSAGAPGGTAVAPAWRVGWLEVGGMVFASESVMHGMLCAL